jgi:hypothetical protein
VSVLDRLPVPFLIYLVRLMKTGYKKDSFDFRDIDLPRESLIQRLPNKSKKRSEITILNDLLRPLNIFELGRIKSNVYVEDQGPTSSCTAHAVTTALEYISDGIWSGQRSRRFVYYEGRVLSLPFWRRGKRAEKFISDSGLSIRSAVKACHRYQVPYETKCPWEPLKVNERTPKELRHINPLNVAYYRISNNNPVMDIALALQSDIPVVLGTRTSEDWGWRYDGLRPLKPVSKAKARGMHAICLLAVVPDGFLFVNSWGKTWGANGFGIIPFESFGKNTGTADIWAISRNP